MNVKPSLEMNLQYFHEGLITNLAPVKDILDRHVAPVIQAPCRESSSNYSIYEFKLIIDSILVSPCFSDLLHSLM